MLHLRLLGALDLTGADPSLRSTDALLSQPKRAALLVYLTLAGPGRSFHRRDALLNLFWPELDDTRSRHALNQALYFLRGCLGARVITNRGADEVGVDFSQITCDVLQLRDLLSNQQLDEAVSLYSGALLPAFHAQELNDFQDWLDRRRQELAESVTNAALTLSTRAEYGGNVAAAIHWARRACAISDLDETCERQLLRLLMIDGNVATARVEYARFAERLQNQLDADPAEATRLILDTPVKTETRVAEKSATPQPSSIGTSSPAQLALGEDATQPRIISSRMRRRVAAVTAIALVVLGTIAARRAWNNGVVILEHGPGERPTILVADFTGPPGDSSLANVATQLALSALQDSRTARVVWSGEETRTLQHMKIRPGTPVRDSVAREVAVRRGYGAVLQGFVRESPGALLVGVSLVAPSTNHVLFMRTANAPNTGALTDAIDGLMRATRRRIGDAHDEIADTKPLAEVTTSSLEALRAFSAARVDSAFDRGSRIALLEKAVTLDTSFAAAYRSLGVELYWANKRERSSEMLLKALQHSDRMSNAEREATEATLYAKGRYYNPVRALAAFNAILARDSMNFIALDNKIWMLMALRQYDLAADLIKAGRKTIQPAGAKVYTNYPTLAQASFLAGRHGDAWRALDAAIGASPTAYMLRANAYQMTGRMDSAEADMRRALELSTERDRDFVVQVSGQRRASMARRAGKLESAHRFDEIRIRMAAARQDPQAMALALMPRLRESARMLHRPDLVRRDLSEFRRLVELSKGVDRPIASLAMTYVDAGDPKTAAALLREMEKTIAPGEWLEVRALIHQAWAHVALAEGRSLDAVREARAADIGVCAICALPLVSLAYERAGQLDSAIATGERYLSTIDPTAITYDGHYRPIIEHRLGRLYLRRGDGVNATRHLAAFIEMWRDADPVLRPQVDSARRELSAAAKLHSATH